MKYVGTITMILAFAVSASVSAQESNGQQEQDKLSYYEQRAKEDAVYEQSLATNNEEDEKDFWKDQKRYEKDLRKRDKEAYKAYMKGKSDAYAEHAEHCDDHCHHSREYYGHAHFYYTYYDYQYPRRTYVGTGVRVSSPSVGISIF
ncbi:MAG: hypothetical protein VXW38_02675 [Bacteroidota bacterium]|nr:hypothetical protein [Bacteroidota bacterium]